MCNNIIHQGNEKNHGIVVNFATYALEWLKFKRLKIQNIDNVMEQYCRTYIAYRNVKLKSYFGRNKCSSFWG